jgi:serine protease AprX
VKLLAIAAFAALTLVVPGVAGAKPYLPSGLVKQCQANNHVPLRVIVQMDERKPLLPDQALRGLGGGGHTGPIERLESVHGFAADLTGDQILRLAGRGDVVAITRDAPVVLSGYSSDQLWPDVSETAALWPQLSSANVNADAGSAGSDSGPGRSGARAPAIAIVDSGIDASRKDFSGRVVAQVNLSSLPNNSPGDGRGHGTFVASIAAGSAPHHPGAAPNAKIVSVDVVDDTGMGLTSDVIAAADWILRNKDVYDIRVANFSLTGSAPSSFRFDPLNKAVERLWVGGVVVVAASGNYGESESGVLHAPGNDPFVITVGATDTAGTVPVGDDFPAPWSSYGSTLDGFAKPELSAPGRMLIGAVPPNSTLALERPDRIVEPGYLRMSGTSASTAIVSGAAADILALHPTWTPDQVKGALMLTASPLALGPQFASGVGEVAASRASGVADPPNPNLALNQFLVPDPSGGSTPVFDEATWTTSALADPTWDAATWTTATWTTATWTTATWTTATWTTATWTTATWTTATWTTATWTTATWTTSLNVD